METADLQNFSTTTSGEATTFVPNFFQTDSKLSPQTILRMKLFTRKQVKSISNEEKIEVADKLEYLENKIQEDLATSQKQERKQQWGALVLTMLGTVSAALLTVILGINLTGKLAEPIFGIPSTWFVNTLALIISAFMTIISDLRMFFDSHELWVRHSATVSQLKNLLYYIRYLRTSPETITMTEVDLIKLDYSRIREETDKAIVKARSSGLSKPN
ncbi:SLATT domain-containing protein [Thermoflexibacter ruber]|uniref:SMODS and SLOG-associating 2TM effector domain-containing protein n=1 Tax=Thermoflexibacter ruber TaxID=1003 RepID=A0A1I2F3Q1_9BACT|nr:SLATT domain-containing protein [Thermoflexibacter ruber]SFE99338.1 hypothetical protein SAMN04488541_101243 [Thermoflexibacter ruber]